MVEVRTFLLNSAWREAPVPVPSVRATGPYRRYRYTFDPHNGLHRYLGRSARPIPFSAVPKGSRSRHYLGLRYVPFPRSEMVLTDLPRDFQMVLCATPRSVSPGALCESATAVYQCSRGVCCIGSAPFCTVSACSTVDRTCSCLVAAEAVRARSGLLSRWLPSFVGRPP